MAAVFDAGRRHACVSTGPVRYYAARYHRYRRAINLARAAAVVAAVAAVLSAAMLEERKKVQSKSPRKYLK